MQVVQTGWAISGSYPPQLQEIFPASSPTQTPLVYIFPPSNASVHILHSFASFD